MTQNGKKENFLTSWKEIAAYLDRDVRTCVRWEKSFGLPVHRLDKESRAKIFAYKDEIDRWLEDRSASGPSEAPKPSPSRPKVWLLLVPAFLVLAAAAYFLVTGLRKDVVPADFHIRESTLVVTNSRGDELWHYDTRLADLEPESRYREHFQSKQQRLDNVPNWPFIRFEDINRDGGIETLFSLQTESDINAGVLICFDAKGVELWRFAAGRELVFGGKVYRREYRIFGFDVADYDEDGKPEILLISFHKPDWPCQVALLDSHGNTKGEYWNSGYLMDAVSGDVDGDGHKETVLSGVNNEYRKGCVIVFRGGALRGGSPQTDAAYRCASLDPGTQTAYILFPTADFHKYVGEQGDAVNHIWIHDGGGMTAMSTETEIYFDLDRRLACASASLSNFTRNLYAKLAREGVVQGPLDENLEKTLAGELVYFRQGAWAQKPPVLDK